MACFLYFLPFAEQLFAQDLSDKWSLTRCFEYAEQNNVQLKQLQLQTQSALINEQQSRSDRLPNFNANASGLGNIGRSLDPYTNTFSTDATFATQFSLNSSVQLYNGGQRKNTVVQRGMELELTRLQSKESAYNLKLGILGAYLQILLSQAQVEVLKAQAKLTQDQLQRAQKLVQAGMIPAGDLLDIEAQIANDQFNQSNGQNAIQSAYLSLRQQLDYYEEPFEVEIPNIAAPSPAELQQRQPQMVLEQALQTQPSLRTIAQQGNIAAQRKKVAAGARYPIVTLNTSLNTTYASAAKQIESLTLPDAGSPTYYVTTGGDLVLSYQPTPVLSSTPFFTQIGDNFGGSISLNVVVPIFNNYRVRNTLSLAQINMDNNRLAQQNTQNALRRNIEQAFLDARAALERYNSAQANIVALENALNYTEKRYQLGAVSTFDFLNAKTRLATTRLQQEAARYEYYFRLKILDFYAGKPL